jgi:hypothetical protein
VLGFFIPNLYSVLKSIIREMKIMSKLISALTAVIFLIAATSHTCLWADSGSNAIPTHQEEYDKLPVFKVENLQVKGDLVEWAQNMVDMMERLFEEGSKSRQYEGSPTLISK